MNFAMSAALEATEPAGAALTISNFCGLYEPSPHVYPCDISARRRGGSG